MGVKSTSRITRKLALRILLDEIPKLPNDTLGDLMDTLADSGQSTNLSQFDNFIVSNFDADGNFEGDDEDAAG